MTAGEQELPYVVELKPPPDVESALINLSARPASLLLDSSMRDSRLGRYSFLTADPFDFVCFPVDAAGGLELVQSRLQVWRAAARPDLPPFQGGAAGLLSYDFGQNLERIPRPRMDEFGIPAIAVGFYDVVLAIDHAEHRAWLISQGLPEIEPAPRKARAIDRLAQFQEWLRVPPRGPEKMYSPALRTDELAPQFTVPGPTGLTSNFSPEGYRAAVQRAIDYIYAGDIFQVNLAQRLLFPATGDPLSLYLRLRQCNPAPFAGWFDMGDTQIVSASPERFLRVHRSVGNALRGVPPAHQDSLHVEARPIKGTRRRTAWAEADLFAGDDLLQSEKDRAENVMIVDLLRNDLSRVCEPDSVRVTQLCGLEIYQFVQHLVSAVDGTLATGKTAIDLVRAAFPGGSITGAPKIRAMEIIAELEPTARGPYCGCLGYFGFDGSADLSILIRTITASRGWLQFPVGGGIVAQSSPQREYEETWHKAEGLLRALR